MKYKPLLGSDLSGHIGGIVASHNTYGPYLRQRVKPVNPKSPDQRAQRAAIAVVSQSWRNLDPLVQQAWGASLVTKTSRKGDKVVLSGCNAYQSCNTLRRRIGLDLITNPPTAPGAASLTSPTATFTDAATLDLTFLADTWNAAGGGVIVSAGLITSSGKSYVVASRAAGNFVHPGLAAVSLTLPYAVPINGRVRLTLHASNPDGRLSQYVDVDVTNTQYTPPASPLLVVRVYHISTKRYLWVFNAPITLHQGIDSGKYLTVDGDSAPGWLTPIGDNAVTLEYGTADGGTGTPWAITGLETGVTPTPVWPQSGLVV